MTKNEPLDCMYEVYLEEVKKGIDVVYFISLQTLNNWHNKSKSTCLNFTCSPFEISAFQKISYGISVIFVNIFVSIDLPIFG